MKYTINQFRKQYPKANQCGGVPAWEGSDSRNLDYRNTAPTDRCVIINSCWVCPKDDNYRPIVSFVGYPVPQ